MDQEKEDLLEENKKLREACQMLGTAMALEMRDPLTVIHGCARLLQEEPDMEQEKKDLLAKSIMEKVEAVSNFINTTLEKVKDEIS